MLQAPASSATLDKLRLTGNLSSLLIHTSLFVSHLNKHHHNNNNYNHNYNYNYNQYVGMCYSEPVGFVDSVSVSERVASDAYCREQYPSHQLLPQPVSVQTRLCRADHRHRFEPNRQHDLHAIQRLSRRDPGSGLLGAVLQLLH